jgi:hypothetical protein
MKANTHLPSPYGKQPSASNLCGYTSFPAYAMFFGQQATAYSHKGHSAERFSKSKESKNWLNSQSLSPALQERFRG